MTNQPSNADAVLRVVFALDESAPAGDVVGALARLLISVAQDDDSDTDNRGLQSAQTQDI